MSSVIIALSFAMAGGWIAIPMAQAELSLSGQMKFNEAQGLLSKRKWPEAAIVLKAVLKESPGDSRVVMDLAKALVFSGRREEALSVLAQRSRAERGDRKNNYIRRERVISRQFLTSATFQIYQDGLNFLRVKKYRQARERFEKALASEADNVEILTRIGQCLVLDADFDSAAERLRLAKKLNPYEPEIRLWLGRALHQRGEIAEGILELKSAEDELDDSELAPVWLAEAEYSGAQKNAALQTLENDLRMKPLHLLSLFTLAKLRYAELSRDPQSQATWTVRKDLQVALSRMGDYAKLEPNRPKSEGELGLDLRDPAELKIEVQSLLDRVEGRLESRPEDQKGQASLPPPRK